MPVLAQQLHTSNLHNHTRSFPVQFLRFTGTKKDLHRLYLLMIQLKLEGLFIRDYVVVRRLIPSGGKRLGLTFMSDLPRQRDGESEG